MHIVTLGIDASDQPCIPTYRHAYIYVKANESDKEKKKDQGYK